MLPFFFECSGFLAGCGNLLPLLPHMLPHHNVGFTFIDLVLGRVGCFRRWCFPPDCTTLTQQVRHQSVRFSLKCSVRACVVQAVMEAREARKAAAAEAGQEGRQVSTDAAVNFLVATH